MQSWSTMDEHASQRRRSHNNNNTKLIQVADDTTIVLDVVLFYDDAVVQQECDSPIKVMQRRHERHQALVSFAQQKARQLQANVQAALTDYDATVPSLDVDPSSYHNPGMSQPVVNAHVDWFACEPSLSIAIPRNAASLAATRSVIANLTSTRSVEVRRRRTKRNEYASGIHMPGNQVSSESIPDLQGTFQIDRVADLFTSQTCFGKCFRACFKCQIGAVRFNDGEAATVIGNTIANLDSVSQISGIHNNPHPGALRLKRGDLAGCFDQAREHI